MSPLSTCNDITDAAIKRSLPVDEVTEDTSTSSNAWPMTSLLAQTRWIASNWSVPSNCSATSGSTSRTRPFGLLVESVLGHSYIRDPGWSREDAASQWTQLEDFLESRLRVK
jgi:hypothetical protein